MAIENISSKTGQDQLLASIEDIERRSMGLNVLEPVIGLLGRPGGIFTKLPPIQSGLTIAVAYIVIFFCIPLLLHLALGDLDAKFSLGFYALQVYGAFWACWATITTNFVVRSLCLTIREEIVPNLQDKTCEAVAVDIRNSFEKRSVLRWSWSIGLISSVLAGCLIYHDFKLSVTVSEVVFWATGWCLLFATSAGVVNVGRFYTLIAKHIKKELDRIYIFQPANSQMIRRVESLGERMLLFWFGIAISITLIFFLMASPSLGLSKSLFIIAQISLAGFFSIGVGTWVFLNSQAALQRAARLAADPLILAIEREAATLWSNGSETDDSKWKRLEELDKWHARITASPSFQSRISSVFSIMLPFIPLLTAIVSLIAKGR